MNSQNLEFEIGIIEDRIVFKIPVTNNVPLLLGFSSEKVDEIIKILKDAQAKARAYEHE